MLSQSSETSDALFDELDPIIRGLGYDIVEVNSARLSGTFSVVLVINRDGGIDVKACADVYKAIYPRLELKEEGADIRLEVSSPGIYRNIKSPREFAIFHGYSVKVLLEDEDDWIKGKIEKADESSVYFLPEQGGEIQKIDFSDIKKAKLDYP
ncbi:MAG: ribosome assembly cofactor RimP [Spirochaetales bacterium]|jgi:ribosome maturation factor RimP|nr:ribosome assembly cofactor RimP [Spirochaetales bacterium]